MQSADGSTLTPPVWLLIMAAMGGIAGAIYWFWLPTARKRVKVGESAVGHPFFGYTLYWPAGGMALAVIATVNAIAYSGGSLFAGYRHIIANNASWIAPLSAWAATSAGALLYRRGEGPISIKTGCAIAGAFGAIFWIVTHVKW